MIETVVYVVFTVVVWSLPWAITSFVYSALYCIVADAWTDHSLDAGAPVATPVSKRNVLLNVALIAPVLGLWFLNCGTTDTQTDLCLVWRVYVVATTAVAYDVFFWAAHRWMHETPELYARIHAAHHRWRYTTHAGSAFDAHPLEMALVNVAPLLAALWLAGADAPTGVAVMLGGTVMTLRAHSDPCGAHNFHHAHRTCGFGALGWMDRVMGTRCGAQCHVDSIGTQKAATGAGLA